MKKLLFIAFVGIVVFGCSPKSQNRISTKVGDSLILEEINDSTALLSNFKNGDSIPEVKIVRIKIQR